MAVTLAMSGCGGGKSDEGKTAATSHTSPDTTTPTTPTTPQGPTAPTKPEPPPPGNVTGLVFDGPVSKARVWCDVNNNGALDESEARVFTDTNGRFNINCPVGNTLMVAGDGTAVDIYTKADMRGVLKGYVQQSTQGFTQVNALTTLAVEMVNQGASVSDAENRLRDAFGIPADVSIYGHHPAANAAVLNGILSMQTTLLSATGELAFIDRAANAADDPSINAIHGVLNKHMAAKITATNGLLDLATKEDLIRQTVISATPDLISNPGVSALVRSRLQTAPDRMQGQAIIAAKIVLDQHDAQFAIDQAALEGVDLTKPLPTALITKIKNASTWVSRFSDPLSLHVADTSATGVLESTYVKSFGGYLQLNDGTFIDPVLKDDGSFAFASDAYPTDDPNEKIILFNPSGDALNAGFTEPLQFDPFTDPQQNVPNHGFSIILLKKGSTPQELIGSNMIYGNARPNIEPGGKYAPIWILPNDPIKYTATCPVHLWVLTSPTDPTRAIGVRIRAPAKDPHELPKNGVVPEPGDPYIIVYDDPTPTNNHSIVFINNGLSGKGVKSFATPVHIW